jgi:hypothetical protein
MKRSAGQNELRPTVSQENISQRAQELWEGYGRPAGRDKEIWLEAERQLLGVDPSVEGMGGISVPAASYDESIKQGKPPSRLTKPKPKQRVSAPAARPAPAKKSEKPKPVAKPVAKPVRKTKTVVAPVASPIKKASVKKTTRTKR